MLSNLCQQARQNSGDNVFRGLSVGTEVEALFTSFLGAHDLTANTRKAFVNDMKKFARWFASANHESLVVERVTTRDIADFRDHLRRVDQQEVSTVNRALVTLRRFFGWLAEEGHVAANPAKKVKELRRQALAPKGLDKANVRRLLREVELRRDVRSNALFTLMLFAGPRVSDVTCLELHDLILSERSGSAVFRFGKGGKQRTVPLPLAVRRALQDYLQVRPPVQTSRIFVGERGPLTPRGVRAICDKYSAICGFKLHPHALRHTFGHQFLADNQNDLVSLAQLLGHESLSTTARYAQRTEQQLGEASDRVSY
jgi:site-specific recombinase XerD